MLYVRPWSDLGDGGAMRNRYSKKDNLSLWNIYHGMKKRCLNPNSKRYKDYGGRGIKICEEWLRGFDFFADWAYSHGYEQGLTIERKDVNGDYCPGNCEWITRADQAYNKRESIIVIYHGESKDLMLWCKELGLKYDTIHHRITHGWSVDRAFETPTDTVSFAEICRENGINPRTAHDRIRKLGWDYERAISTPSKGRGANQKSYEL